MQEIFVDTGAWAALADSRDSHHKAALAFRDEMLGQYQIIITNYILDELYTLLLLNTGYNATVSFKKQIDVLIASDVIRVIWITEELALQSWAIFEKFNQDKAWSFTDCVSYQIMQVRGIREVFAFDHHFEQMGYVRRP